jgi:hypothetical protein
MRFSRLLRGTLPVLLLWPLVCSIVTLSMAPARQRDAAMRPMACCALPERGDTCGSCDHVEGAGCGLDRSADTGCMLTATPCRRATPSTLTPFAWEPFVREQASFARPSDRGRHAPLPPTAFQPTRSIAVDERPPAA